MCAKFCLMGYHRVNLLKSELCYALFYSNCIVICTIEPNNLKTKIRQIKSQAKVKKVNIFERPLLIHKDLEDYGKSIAELSETQAYGLNKKNKMIYYDEIHRIIYHPLRIDISCESCLSKSGILVIKSDENNITIYHDCCKKSLLDIEVLNKINIINIINHSNIKLIK